MKNRLKILLVIVAVGVCFLLMFTKAPRAPIVPAVRVELADPPSIGQLINRDIENDIEH